jgi:hypothetical protein
VNRLVCARSHIYRKHACPWVVALFEYLQLVAYCNRQIAETKRSAL